MALKFDGCLPDVLIQSVCIIYRHSSFKKWGSKLIPTIKLCRQKLPEGYYYGKSAPSQQQYISSSNCAACSSRMWLKNYPIARMTLEMNCTNITVPAGRESMYKNDDSSCMIMFPKRRNEKMSHKGHQQSKKLHLRVRVMPISTSSLHKWVNWIHNDTKLRLNCR